MARKSRRTHAPSCKALVAPEAIREDKAVAELVKNYEVHPTQIVGWKRQLVTSSAEALERGASAGSEPTPDMKELHAKIGHQAAGIHSSRRTAISHDMIRTT